MRRAGRAKVEKEETRARPKENLTKVAMLRATIPQVNRRTNVILFGNPVAGAAKRLSRLPFTVENAKSGVPAGS